MSDGQDCLSGNCDGTTCVPPSSSGSGSSSGLSSSGSGGGSGGSSASGSGGGSGGSSGSGGDGPPCSDPNYELPNIYPQAVEGRFNNLPGAANVPEYIVDIGRYANQGGEDKYAVRKITGNGLPTISGADYMSIAAIRALNQDKLFFIATLPPAGPLSVNGSTVAGVRTAAFANFPSLTNICPVQGGGISP